MRTEPVRKLSEHKTAMRLLGYPFIGHVTRCSKESFSISKARATGLDCTLGMQKDHAGFQSITKDGDSDCFHDCFHDFNQTDQESVRRHVPGTEWVAVNPLLVNIDIQTASYEGDFSLESKSSPVTMAWTLAASVQMLLGSGVLESQPG